MINRLKELLLGSPLPTFELRGIKLNKIRALAAFSPDALSSIAYANQEIYLALVAAGAVGLSRSLPIGLVIVTLLGIVALSYAQLIHRCTRLGEGRIWWRGRTWACCQAW